MPDLWVNLLPVWEWAKSAMALLGLGGLTIGGAAAVAYGLFKWLGEKWINQKFQAQLEANKAEQSRELERLRHKINGVFDRTIRLHTKEFEVLPDLWAKLVEAHAWGSGFVSLGQSYANVSFMDDAALAEYLDATTFMDSQKRDIKAETNPMERQNLFTKIANLYRHNDTFERIRVFGTSLRKDGIFVQPEIKADMDIMLGLIHNAVSEKKLNDDESIQPRLRDAYNTFQAEAQALLEKIELAVAARLWDSTTTEV
ncbi:hypothetical protein [Rhizobium leguminosarum]|uniref:hypothetical protein n=1 Tax=Rhizobium leguminosarum TaxID=384 RepID=UPI003F9E60AC